MIIFFPPQPLMVMTDEGLIEIHDHSEAAQHVEADIRSRWNHGLTVSEVITHLCGVMGRVSA